MEFQVRLTCVQDVLDFVTLATSRPFSVTVGDRHHQVNGKSFMEMFCLTLTKPLRVTLLCSEDQFQDFLSQTTHFQV